MKKIIIILVITTCISLTGCFAVDNEFKSIRNITLKEYGRNFITDHEFALGSFELWLAEGIVSIAADDEMAEEILSSVSGVQIGIYKNKFHEDLPNKKLLKKIDNQMEKRGWKYIVKSYNGGEMAAVYINKDAEKMLRELYVISIDDEEMVIVQVLGDLEKVIEAAIREHGISWVRQEGYAVR